MTAATFNILTTPWLPVRRLSGVAEVIRPARITDGVVGPDPIITIDWPRPDFRVATLELLIGLLALAAPPRDLRAWVAGWRKPPSPDELDAAFAPFAHAFDLDGPGSRFLQDLEDLQADTNPAEALLIEAPGASAADKNTDLLVKRGRAPSFSRASAAIALYTLQSWAPEGGRGNFTGVRGGGPLVTLVQPERQSLWHMLWANTPCGEVPLIQELPRILPWLAPTITAERARTVTPEAQAHSLQVFWGMPRRIRLDFTPLEKPRPCDLTASMDAVHVRTWRQRPYGPKYVAWGKQHPLSPYYYSKAGAEWLPVHPQPGGIGYRHWVGLVVKDEANLPAATIAAWRGTRRRDAGEGSNTRILAAGFDMKSMKARAFIESEMPLPGGTAEDQDRLDALASALVRAADTAAGLLRNAARNAIFSPGAKVKLDAEGLSSLRERLWAQTEQPFYDALRSAAERHGEEIGAEPERAAWAKLLHQRAMALFDEAAPLGPEAGAAAPRIADARRALNFALLGFGKMGKSFFGTLGLVEPQRREDAA